MDSALRLARTVRWLRPVQVIGQLKRRLLGSYLPPADYTPVQPDAAVRWSPHGDFLPPGAPPSAAELRAGRFTFLNDRREIGWPPRWDVPEATRLWQYNLHYFEYLWALDYEDARAVVSHWIEAHPPSAAAVGWEPYPISLRLLNWCAFFFGRERGRIEDDEPFRRRLWQSLAAQAEVLRREPETHILGNHLLENAAALAFAGACLAGPDAEAWGASGLALLRSELAEQMLADGGHFERSAMYHARVTYVLGLLLATGSPRLRAAVEAPLERALRALRLLTHPDGEIALLNDSAFGIVARSDRIVPEPAPDGPFALADTGYFGARSGGHYIVCDAGPVGPDHQPGHAHGDLFSFELSLHGARVLVDAGCHDYEQSELRRWCRSTRAHNTVEVAGADQCEFWGAFRVARRARPHDVVFEEIDGGFRLSGWHDGYQRLAGDPRHRRSFRWHPEGVLLVRDGVRAGRALESRARLHLHPDCRLLELDGALARVGHPAGDFTVVAAGPTRLSEEPSCYCPEFGRRQDNVALVLTAEGSDVEWGFCVAAGTGTVGYDLPLGAQVDGRRFGW